MSAYANSLADAPDETDIDLRPPKLPQPSPSLLRLLRATVQDEVSRLDTPASVAPASVRACVIGRMAWREALLGNGVGASA